MTDGRLILYTWHDVEKILLLDKTNWPAEWINIETFSTELIIYVNNIDETVKEHTRIYLKQLLKQYYSEDQIWIDKTKTKMELYWEKTETEEKAQSVPFPLFKDFLYVNESNHVKLPELSGVPVTVFHSYKGGVGRTLSLITMVRDLIQEFGTEKKVLIIDSDVEAPGLTWLGREQNGSYPISYMDILAIIGAKGDDDEIIENVSRVIEQSVLTFHTDMLEVSQYFLPTYRIEEQIFDIYASPERIMAGEKNKYIIVDVLSKIGKVLNVDMVLVDLRAGVSEYSAPFLFDSRVNKIIVSSTSYQSVYGTGMLLQQMGKQKGNGITNIFLTMVLKETFIGKTKNDVYQHLLYESDYDESEDMSSDITRVDDIIEIEKSDALIHLGSLEEICETLNSAGNITEAIRKVVKDLFQNPQSEKAEYDIQTIEKFRSNLYEITRENVTAEGSDYSNLLAIKPVQQLGNFVTEIPKINILGAKGSGKTYLYKQMAAAKTWGNFLKILGKESCMEQETLICPVLCTEDRIRMLPLLQKCVAYCKEKLPNMVHNTEWLSDNEQKVREAIGNQYSEGEWQKFWDRLFLDAFENIHTWKDLNGYLEEKQKKIIFLVDGLETLFGNVVKNKTEKDGINVLCKRLLNRLYESGVEHIGMIIFLRKDIAELSIDINKEQFKNQYQQYELNWSQKDALLLAWKFASRAAKMSGLKDFGDADTLLYSISQKALEEKLTKVWGRKMGPDSSKTAGTVRWVLASLSDFNGQLQARDIVRFLEVAVKENRGSLTQYQDRFMTPEDMKESVIECSEAKLGEVEQEIYQLKKSFQILRDVEQKDKQIPLSNQVLEKLDNEDRKTLERYGYLKEADGEYYIPESIRYALGYNKSRRGGTKLVSLLVRK